MIRHLLALTALCILSGWAGADYLLIKLDYDQLNFVKEASFEDIAAAKGGNFNHSSKNCLHAIIEYSPDQLKFIRPPDKNLPPPAQPMPMNPPPVQQKQPGGQPNPGGQPGGKGGGKGGKVPPVGPPGGVVPPPPPPVQKPPPVPQRKEVSNKDAVGIELNLESGKKIFPNIPGLIAIRKLERKPLKEEYFLKRRSVTVSVQALNLALWSLQHGLMPEFHQSMELLQQVSPGHPVYGRYTRVREALRDRPPFDPVFSRAMQKQLKDHQTKVSKEGHYVIYWKKTETELEDEKKLSEAVVRRNAELTELQMDRRLARLENSFNNYYYWCALQDEMTPPAMPSHRLPILVEPVPAFNKRLKDLGLPNGSTSGITLRQENLIVVSSEPNTPVYRELRNNFDLVRMSRLLNDSEALASGAVWKNKDSYDANGRPKVATAKLHTLAVLQKLMEDDVEYKTLSREGTRQLLITIKLLPRNVEAPEWLQSGLISFFEIPSDRLHLGFGLPRSDLLDTFRSLPAEGKPFSRASVRLDLATNRYFRTAKKEDAGAAKEGGSRKAPRAEKGDDAKGNMGEAVSWALVYYLASQRKTNQMSAYADMINELPRYMKIHPEILDAKFKTAFKMDDIRAQRDGLDEKKWFADMETVTAENREVEQFFSAANTTTNNKKRAP